MTDVDETIPLATLSITPQTPGVTAGTGTVNTVPLATLSITPNAPGFQRYPLFEVLDSNGNRIDTVTFENLSAGVESDVQVITLVNNSGSSVSVTLTATIGESGTLTETATSTLLSEDDADYVFTTDTYTIPANSTLPVYIKWRPPSTSRPGLKTWTLTMPTTILTPLTGWDYVGEIDIPGSIDGALTDYQCLVIVPYLYGYMKDDFGDIRFTLPDQTPLSYHLKRYTEGVSAEFTVKIPVIAASPDTTTIHIHSGNSSAATTSSPEDVYLFFDDASGTYADNWVNITGTGSYTEVGGEQAISLDSATTNIRTNTFQVTAPFMVEVDLYETAVITAIQYCQDSTPTTNERYHARVDVRGSPDGGDGILKDAVFITTSEDKFSTASEWVTCILTLNTTGGHSWSVDGKPPLTATDNSYSTGYLVLNHHNSGTGAAKNLMVSKYTTNPPVVGEFTLYGISDIAIVGGVVYTIPDLPELDLQNQYIINVGGVGYE